LEIEKFFPQLKITQEACPMWVPLVENNEHLHDGADYFTRKHIGNIIVNHPEVDTLLLACTHYPLLKQKIRKFLPEHIQLISQSDIVAKSLLDYLQRHPEIEARISKRGGRKFYTTDSTIEFDQKATNFFGATVQSNHLDLSL
jgi:glutamate racemase